MKKKASSTQKKAQVRRKGHSTWKIIFDFLGGGEVVKRLFLPPPPRAGAHGLSMINKNDFQITLNRTDNETEHECVVLLGLQQLHSSAPVKMKAPSKCAYHHHHNCTYYNNKLYYMPRRR